MYAEIRAPGFRYRLSPLDVLWTARAVAYETSDPEEQAATLWTLTQAFVAGTAAVPNPRERFGSLANFVRAYAQPVNPLWDSLDDDKCRRFPESCTPRQMARRTEARTALFWNLDEAAEFRSASNIESIVKLWAAGALPNPVPGAVEYANPAVSSGFVSRVEDAEVVRRSGQWYIALGRNRDRAENVTMGGGFPLLAGFAIGTLVAGLVVGGAYLALGSRS